MNSKIDHLQRLSLLTLAFVFLFGPQIQCTGNELALSGSEPGKPNHSFRRGSFGQQDSDRIQVQRLFNDKIQPLLKKSCGDCHWGADAEAGFNLESYVTFDQLLNGRKKWQKAFVQVVGKKMPPEGEPSLSTEDHTSIVDWIDNLLNSVDCTEVRPGRVTIRRLNRTEYKNTVRDLFGIEYQPADEFPGDDVGYGFDNIADVISLPPILMEKYLQAAEEITSQAIVDPEIALFEQTLSGEQFTKTGGSQTYDLIHLMTTNGTINCGLNLPKSGEYKLRVRAFGDQAGDELVKMAIGVDGTVLETIVVSAEEDNHGQYELVAKLKQGKNNLEVGFLNDYYEKEKGDRNLYLVSVSIEGPAGWLPKFQRKLLPQSPNSPTRQRAMARKALNKFTSRAYRRPVNEDQLSRLMDLYEHSRSQGEGFELSVRFAIQAVLVSPHFLYRIETPAKSGQVRDLGDFEVATRLSYFLWSTMPDAKLLGLARQGSLLNPDIYQRQIVRMMQDPKFESMVENFVAQWLQLRHLQSVNPDPDLFPGIDQAMRNDMATETKMVVADLIRRNKSVFDIFESGDSYINQRLARHYGIKGIKGDHFRKLSVSEYGRRGLMTQASILTLTSNPTRTSPVKRGKWIMENLLGEEPPPPDPEAMTLENQGQLTGTLRQRMEQHRADPACASCHQVMDQLGFALENFDAVGKWRDKEESGEIDARGRLPDGTDFQGAIELQQTLKTKMQDQFVRCLTEKMLIYSLGRGLEYFDQCAVDKIVLKLKPDDYRFSDLIIAVASSEPFLKAAGPPVTIDNQLNQDE